VLCPTIAIPLLLTLLSISTTFSPQPHSTPPKKARPGGQGEHMRCVLPLKFHFTLCSCQSVATWLPDNPTTCPDLETLASKKLPVITYRGNPQSTTTLIILSRTRLRLYTATANTYNTKIPPK